MCRRRTWYLHWVHAVQRMLIRGPHTKAQTTRKQSRKSGFRRHTKEGSRGSCTKRERAPGWVTEELGERCACCDADWMGGG